MTKPYWYVTVYNADGGQVERSGPYYEQEQADRAAESRKRRIDNAGWSYEVIVTRDQQFDVRDRAGRH